MTERLTEDQLTLYALNGHWMTREEAECSAVELIDLRAAIPFISHKTTCAHFLLRDFDDVPCDCGYDSLPAWIRELAEGGGE